VRYLSDSRLMSARPSRPRSARPARRALGWVVAVATLTTGLLGVTSASAQTPPVTIDPNLTTTSSSSPTTSPTTTATPGPTTTRPAPTTTAPGGRPPVPKVQKQAVADPVFDQGLVVDRFNALLSDAMASLIGADRQIATARDAILAAQSRIGAARVAEGAAEAEVARWREGIASVAVGSYVAGPGGDLDASLQGNPQDVYRQFTLTQVVRGLKAAQQAADRQRSAVADAQRDFDKATADAAAADKAKADGFRKIADLERQAAEAEVKLMELAIGDQALTPDQAKALLAAALKRRGQSSFGPPPPVDARTQNAVQFALAQQGKPYQWGGNGPDSFDCSGLTQQSYLRAGVVIPRVAADQQAALIPVSLDEAQPGDLVFFGYPATHVGMYIGNGNMVDAPYTGSVVRVEPIYRSSLSGLGRVLYPS